MSFSLRCFPACPPQGTPAGASLNPARFVKLVQPCHFCISVAPCCAGVGVCELFSRVQLSNPMDHSPLGTSVHGIFQGRILEWLPCPSPGHLPNSGIEPGSPTLWADSLPSELPGKIRRGWYRIPNPSFCPSQPRKPPGVVLSRFLPLLLPLGI